MFTGWISLRVKDPSAIGEWYKQVTGLQVVGRPDMGAIALGTEEHGPAIILLPGESIEHADRLQMHFPVPDVDAEYNRLLKLGVQFDEPPEDKPWGWRHA
jgi:predicted enzyme related to lactoylglutathione lyase